MLITTLDYLAGNGHPDLQAALDDAQDGDVVYMPGYLDYIAPPGGFKIIRRIELRGAGPGDPGLITVKGLDCVKKADVIIYDYLANERLLEQRRPDADAVGEHEVPLQQLELAGRNVLAREPAEARVDAVHRLALGDQRRHRFRARGERRAAGRIELDTLAGALERVELGEREAAGDEPH